MFGTVMDLAGLALTQVSIPDCQTTARVVRGTHSATVAFTLKAGEWVTAITGVVVVLKPGIARKLPRVRDPTR